MNEEMSQPDVVILLAAYNGALYIEDQIKSIISQSLYSWIMLIRDDGSSDGTINILENIANTDSRIVLLKDSLGRLGAKENFHELLRKSLVYNTPYTSFSDQDDVWDIKKLEQQLATIKKLEFHNLNHALLVYSDMEVSDKELNSISPSFMQYQMIEHKRYNALNTLLVNNFVTGCTIMINRDLVKIGLSIPKEALIHDWWFALCAAAFGKIEYIDKPLVKYRQHDSNMIGAKNYKGYLNPFKTNLVTRWLKGRVHFYQSIAQANSLLKRIILLDPDNSNLKLIEAYASLHSLPRLQRIRILKENKFYCKSRLRHYIMLFRLLL